MNTITFEEFASAARGEGCDQILQREWARGTAIESHAHALSGEALVAQGPMALSVGESSRQLGVDAGFELDRAMRHDQRCGPQRCTLRVARRHGSDAR
jgi:hypothetical protein